MSLLRRRTMYKAGELPAGYKLCEWLSSKNDAYLIIDYYPKIGDAIEMYFSVDRKRDFDAPIYAVSEYDSGRQLAVLVGYDNSYFKYFTTGAASPAQNAYFASYVGSEPRKLVIDKDGRLKSYTGDLITGGEVQKDKKEVNAPLFLFERSDHKHHFSGKIGTVKFTRGEKKSLNLIPCLNEHNIPCMYDTVSGKSYYNKGTGTFGYKLLQEAEQ